MTSSSVLVVGAGLSGLACARALTDRGVAVRVVDRARVVGGRLASKRIGGRVVDLGARYFTVPPDSAFERVVADWTARGLVRPWTDTFQAVEPAPDGAAAPVWQRKHGPVRHSAPAGLRSLATDLAERLTADGVPIDLDTPIDAVGEDGRVAGTAYDAVVLAMPDPQASRLVAAGSPLGQLLQPADWEPALAVTIGWAERHWPRDLHGVFVGGSDVLAFVADDGDRRGDGAPVLVAHTTAAFARAHLEHPETALDEVVDAVSGLLGIDARPAEAHVHRWSFANPGTQHPEPFGRNGRIAVCGDAWGERSSVSTAWASGDALGRALP